MDEVRKTFGGRARRALPSAVLAGLLLVATAARGQVLEIGDDGQVTRHSGPAQYLSADLAPRYIAPAAPARPAPPAAIREAIRESGARHGVDPALVEAVAWQESRFRADAVSAKGAVGVMQLMPGTARDLGVDPRDARANVEGGTAYLGWLMARYGGDTATALAAYNAGPNAVERHGGQSFAETRAYVTAVLQRLARSRTGGP